MSGEKYPKRKKNRLEKFDYSSGGAYFITICLSDRRAVLWENVGADMIRPQLPSLSREGKAVEEAVNGITAHYPAVTVEHYCIMPDHVHLLLLLNAEENGRMLSAPTVSTVVGQLKRWVSRQTGESFWQKSFYDRVIRGEEEYREIWRYIDENPYRPDKTE